MTRKIKFDTYVMLTFHQFLAPVLVVPCGWGYSQAGHLKLKINFSSKILDRLEILFHRIEIRRGGYSRKYAAICCSLIDMRKVNPHCGRLHLTECNNSM